MISCGFHGPARLPECILSTWPPQAAMKIARAVTKKAKLKHRAAMAQPLDNITGNLPAVFGIIQFWPSDDREGIVISVTDIHANENSTEPHRRGAFPGLKDRVDSIPSLAEQADRVHVLMSNRYSDYGIRNAANGLPFRADQT